VLWILLGGAAALKLAYIIFSHTPHPNYRIPLAIGVALLHLGFLLYLHFAYHELAEEVSHILMNKIDNMPAKLSETVAAVVNNDAKGKL
jgi:dipeptide/tripeptide permease